MNNKTLIKLEFDKIISMLENEASSFRGKQLCRRLKPVTDLTKIDLLQEQTAAWLFLLFFISSLHKVGDH